MSIELPATTRHCRDMTDNVESDVKSEQTNKQTNKQTKNFVEPVEVLRFIAWDIFMFELDNF